MKLSSMKRRPNGHAPRVCPEEAAAAADCVVMVSHHAALDYQVLVDRSRREARLVKTVTSTSW